MPLLLEALDKVAKERPDDPIEFFSYYLLKNNPYNEKLKNVH